MRKRKISIVFFIIILLIQSVVYANSPKYVLLKKEKLDDKVKIIVSIKDVEKGIVGLQGKLEYNKDSIQIIETKVLNDNYILTAFNKENGMFLIEANDETFFDKNKQIKNGDILEIICEVKNKTNINLTDIKIVDSDFQTIECENAKLNMNNNIWLVIIIILIIIIFVIIKNKRKIKK